MLTNPIGLAGFAVFLVFGFLAKKGKKPQWLAIGAYVMALIALAGGLVLAYLRANPSASQTRAFPVGASPTPISSVVNQQNIGQIKQQSSGIGAINTAGVQGQVTVNQGTPPATATPRRRK